MRRSECRTKGALRRLFALWLFLCVVGVAGTLRADDVSPNDLAPPKQLTSGGRLLIAGGVGGSYSNDRSAGPDALKRWRFYVTPSLTYWLRDRIGVGVALGAGVSEASYGYGFANQESHIYVGLSGAFDLPLAGRLSLLFQPELGYTRQWAESALVGPPGVGVSALPGQVKFHMQTLRGVLNIHLLVRMSPSLAIGVGPDVWVDWIVDDDGLRAAQSQHPPGYPAPPEGKYVRLQLGLTVGLWFSL